MIKFEVEYEIPQMRYASVWCPSCDHKFDARKHGKTDDGGRINDGVDIHYAIFKCPVCKEKFKTRGKDLNVIEY